MIRGIGGKPYINLDEHLDIEGFRNLHYEIAKGFALAKDYAKEGTWMKPGFDWSDASYIINWKPIYQAWEEYQALPDDDPIKTEGNEILPENFGDYKQRNIFTRYLKMAMDAYDPYSYYFLWEEGDWNSRNSERTPTEIQKYFPGVTKWVYDLVDQKAISKIGRVIFFHRDHNAIQFEHRDLDAKNGVFEENFYTPHRNEFIYLRYRTKSGFYIWDPEKQNKHYLNCHAAFFNDQDWHGGDRQQTLEYSLRIDCEFTEEFRKKIGISHLEHY